MWETMDKIISFIPWGIGIMFLGLIIWTICIFNNKSYKQSKGAMNTLNNKKERENQLRDSRMKKYMPIYLKLLAEANITDKSNVVALIRDINSNTFFGNNYVFSIFTRYNVHFLYYVWKDRANNLCFFPCGLSANAEIEKSSRLLEQISRLEEDVFPKIVKVTKIPISRINRFVESGSQYRTSHEMETMRSKADRQLATIDARKANQGGNSAVKGAVVGGIVGGVPGAIIGSNIGANQQANRNSINIPAPRYGTASMSHDKRTVSLYIKGNDNNDVILKFKSAYMPAVSYSNDDDMPDEIKYNEAKPFEDVFITLIPEKHGRNV